ncbi:hypothetical protein N7528_007463, partial [Penicillium herquei]
SCVAAKEFASQNINISSTDHHATDSGQINLKEECISVFIQVIQKQEINSIRETGHRFNVPESLLRTRLHDTPNCADTRANKSSLKQRIISLNIRGATPTQAHIREMANMLLAKCGSIPIQTVGGE